MSWCRRSAATGRRGGTGGRGRGAVDVRGVPVGGVHGPRGHPRVSTRSTRSTRARLAVHRRRVTIARSRRRPGAGRRPTLRRMPTSRPSMSGSGPAPCASIPATPRRCRRPGCSRRSRGSLKRTSTSSTTRMSAGCGSPHSGCWHRTALCWRPFPPAGGCCTTSPPVGCWRSTLPSHRDLPPGRGASGAGTRRVLPSSLALARHPRRQRRGARWRVGA